MSKLLPYLLLFSKKIETGVENYAGSWKEAIVPVDGMIPADLIKSGLYFALGYIAIKIMLDVIIYKYKRS